ncbi:signal peptidase I [Candidatus Saccharibacteria bacterium]|nr:signal peptidase I [Candidatus Saccharibacteria bacterium]
MGSTIGGFLAVYGIVAIAIFVLMIVAWWKIFTKAGEEGWKSIIPIYNVYILCKIMGINFWIYVLAIPAGLGLLTSFIPQIVFLTGIYALFIAILVAIKLGDAFGKSTGFKVGLFFLPNIFELILAFGDSKYVGKKAVAKKK